MAHPLMPKATAIWLIDNSLLTFDQIADFCGLHHLEIQALADGDVAPGMQGLDPVGRGELKQQELDRCQADPGARLVLAEPDTPLPKPRKSARYTPVAKRGDRPNAIAWLLKNYPELKDAQISRLIGTTKPTINAIRDRSHWNTINIKPQNPVGMGLCAGNDLEKAIALAHARAGKIHAPGAATAPDGVVDASPGQPGQPTATPPPQASPQASDNPIAAMPPAAKPVAAPGIHGAPGAPETSDAPKDP